ncbi:MAG: histidine--tRNA ligase [Kofleriaceae bacterium]
MAEAIASVKGMNDILPPDSAAWQRLEAAARAVFTAYGYGEIRTPIVEHTELFARGIGESTDVVGKEMYTFEDRAQRSLTLRPEMTAGCARAYLEHGLAGREPVTRWWYGGPMFRYERMQVGRYRQFWQLGAECFGVAEPTLDAEQIAMLHALFAQLGVGELTACINNVGSGDDRVRYRAALVEYFTPHAGALCADCQRRLAQNPLRILDCKVPGCRAIAADAPQPAAFLSPTTAAHFEGLQAALTAMRVPFRIDPRLVRGLDYYTGTVFEIVSGSSALGAQTTVVGGGRYDGLIEQLGGPATPAFGFAFGVERALLAMGADGAALAARPALFIATRGAAARLRATALAQVLRGRGLVIEVEHREVGMKAQLRRAEKLGSTWVLALGDDELARGEANVRDMATRAEHPVAIAADADLGALIGHLTAAR